MPQLAHCWHKYLLYDMCAAPQFITQKQLKMLLFVHLFLSSSFSEHFVYFCEHVTVRVMWPWRLYCVTSAFHRLQICLSSKIERALFLVVTTLFSLCVWENLPRTERTDLTPQRSTGTMLFRLLWFVTVKKSLGYNELCPCGQWDLSGTVQVLRWTMSVSKHAPCTWGLISVDDYCRH